MESQYCLSDQVFLWLQTVDNSYDPAEPYSSSNPASEPPPNFATPSSTHPLKPEHITNTPPISLVTSTNCRNPFDHTRKRKRSMNSNLTDAASLFSASTRSDTGSTVSIRDRPILQPTPPSSRSRASSPVRPRTVLNKLPHAQPSVRICQPDISIQQPPGVSSLRSQLMARVSSGILPLGLKDKIQLADPDQSPSFSHLYETFERPRDYNDTYWRMVENIYNHAQNCHNYHVDENGWSKIVEEVLEAVERLDGTSKLRLQGIQSQGIAPAFIPQHASIPLARKTDHALAFTRQHQDVVAAIDPYQKANPQTNLSHMVDAYTSTIPLVCGIEVKESGGDYNEAIVQLGIWCAAGLSHLRSIQSAKDAAAEQDALPPFLGFTVVGHDWKLHITWKSISGDVTVLGPWWSLKAGTGSYIEIMTLIALIQGVKHWLETEYWDWLCENIFNAKNCKSNIST